MAAAELETLIALLARLPGLGPRSARRVALHALKRRDVVLRPLAEALARAAENVGNCSICGNLDSCDPCSVCADHERDRSIICVVEEVDDLWALEKAAVFHGGYHVLGGTLSALDGIGPPQLRIDRLLARIAEGGVDEVILATGATVDGQTTAHYLTQRLKGHGVRVSRLAQGVPIGGEVNYLDEGTLDAALRARTQLA